MVVPILDLLFGEGEFVKCDLSLSAKIILHARNRNCLAFNCSDESLSLFHQSSVAIYTVFNQNICCGYSKEPKTYAKNYEENINNFMLIFISPEPLAHSELL